jgi:hypothetical protein
LETLLLIDLQTLEKYIEKDGTRIRFFKQIQDYKKDRE